MLSTASLTAAMLFAIAPVQMPARHSLQPIVSAPDSVSVEQSSFVLAQMERAVPPPEVAPDEQTPDAVQPNEQNDQTDQAEQPETAAQDQPNPDEQNASNDEGPVMPPQAPQEPPPEAEMPSMPVYPPALTQ